MAAGSSSRSRRWRSSGGRNSGRRARPGIDEVLHQLPDLARVQPVRQRVDGHQPGGVHPGEIRAIDNLPLRRLEDVAAPEDADPAADHDAAVGGERFGQVGLVVPDDADIAGLVADDGLGGAAAAGPGLIGLPDVGDDGLLLALDELGDELDLAVVEVAVGEEIEQVAHRFDAQLAELFGQGGADAADGGHRRFEGVFDRRWPAVAPSFWGLFYGEQAPVQASQKRQALPSISFEVGEDVLIH